ncbi:MAG: T9SS type A sorting domain-containing protein [Saprospiraceae bacterium]
MNKKITILSALVALSALVYLIVLYWATGNPTASKAYNSLDEKWEPNQHHFLQRVSSKGRIELKAYEKALAQARSEVKNRNAAPGFATPWTVQGPGNSGSRVNTIAVHPTNSDIIYLGYASGGVFKTTDGGQHWEAIFDDQNFLGIGDITLDPNNPNIVYVGTGDVNVTSYPFIGDGLYRSNDGGATWTNLGLTEQRIISKIIVDPTDSDIIYVATLGLPFQRNNERGLYKTTDGGATWNQVLFLSNQTGVIDFLLHPTNTQILYAAGWDRISNSSENIGTGPGAKIHKSTDGGATWTMLTNGLPMGNQSRIGLAMSNSNPDLVYAMYINTSFQLGGVYKTTDAGASWTSLPQTGLHQNVMGGQGWYFGKIRVHPNDHDKIYILGLHVNNTLDGGNQWFTLTSSTSSNPVHVDMHDLVFTNNGLTVLLATDGGAYRSTNGGGSFQKMENIPATQMYRIAYDPHRPHLFYGGTQDNGSVAGNAATINQWERLIGADGFQPAFNPVDSNIFYLETQRGGIKVTTDAGQSFFNATSGFGLFDRKNWDMPYLINQKNPEILYAGTERVYRSETSSGVPAWQAISGDLCDTDFTNNPLFHTISCLSNSEIDSAIVLAGTSDGNVWRTENEGSSWTKINANLPDRYVTSIKASTDDADEIYVSFSGYDDNVFTPLIYKSTDAGNSWNSISGDLPQLAINDIYILPNTGGNAIFAATDGGVYATLNGGTEWERLGTEMPFVPVFDLDWHAADNLIIAGTHGRSVMTFPLDSIAIPAPSLLANFGGTVQTPDGDLLDSTLVATSQGAQVNAHTDENGAYLLEQIPYGLGCQIAPYKNTNPRNGVNLFDLVLMQKHILNTQVFTSPYQRIAADQDQNGEVSILDIIEFRKLLLFLSTELPNHPAWRFIPSNFVFPNPLNPYETTFPESYDCADLTGSDNNLDFVAIKMGDVDYDANASNLQLSDVRNFAEPSLLVVKDLSKKRGEVFPVKLQLEKSTELLGLQFTLTFDPQELQFMGLESSSKLNSNASHWNTTKASEGILSFCWHQAEALTLQPEDLILTLNFTARNAIVLSEALRLSTRYTTPEVLRQENATQYELANLALQFKDSSEQFIPKATATIFPNPFTTATKLNYQLDQPAEVYFQIVNVQGQVLQTQRTWQTAGSHEIILSENLFVARGVYYCVLKIGAAQEVIRILKE